MQEATLSTLDGKLRIMEGIAYRSAQVASRLRRARQGGLLRREGVRPRRADADYGAAAAKRMAESMLGLAAAAALPIPTRRTRRAGAVTP